MDSYGFLRSPATNMPQEFRVATVLNLDHLSYYVGNNLSVSELEYCTFIETAVFTKHIYSKASLDVLYAIQSDLIVDPKLRSAPKSGGVRFLFHCSSRLLIYLFCDRYDLVRRV